MIEKIYQVSDFVWCNIEVWTLAAGCFILYESYSLYDIGLQYVWRGPGTVHDEPVIEIPLLILVYEFGRWPLNWCKYSINWVNEAVRFSRSCSWTASISSSLPSHKVWSNQTFSKSSTFIFPSWICKWPNFGWDNGEILCVCLSGKPQLNFPSGYKQR